VKRLAVVRAEDATLPIEDAMTLNEAMEYLEKENPGQARIVECRYLLGMTVDETAAVLGQSRTTVEREWREAKVLLSHRIHPARE